VAFKLSFLLLIKNAEHFDIPNAFLYHYMKSYTLLKMVRFFGLPCIYPIAVLYGRTATAIAAE